MSKNITIQEGGVAKQMTVDKLKTNLVGGGTCLWVPEDEVTLGQKTISENGTYKASDDGLYGYSQVMVSNAGIASGTIPSGATIPTGDGNEYAVTTDGSGNLDFLKIPSSIRITTQPTTTEYYDGDTIDYTGMVVTKYDANGQSMGTVALSELILPVTQADVSKASKDSMSGPDGTVGQIYVIDASEAVAPNRVLITSGPFESTVTGEVRFARLYRNTMDGQGVGIFASDTPGNRLWYGPSASSSGYYIQANLSAPYTYNGKTVYYSAAASYGYGDQSDTDFYVQMSGSRENYDRNSGLNAWTMIYGELVKGSQTIPVKWPRTGDGKVLETNFEITVEAVETQGDEGGDTPAPHDDPTIYYEDVNEAINLALMGGDETVYFKGNTYTMEEAIALRDSSPHRL